MLAVTVAGCGGGGTTTQKAANAPGYAIHGTLLITGPKQFKSEGAYCSGRERYSDFKSEAQVAVKNPHGALIGTATLGRGEREDILHACSFGFTVSGLPKASFYRVSVAETGESAYSFAELEQRDWRIRLALG